LQRGVDTRFKKQPDGQITAPIPTNPYSVSLTPSSKLGAQHHALDLVGAALDLVGVVGEVNAFDHGAALEHRGGALQLQILRPC
jgi:hypothetical protein